MRRFYPEGDSRVRRPEGLDERPGPVGALSRAGLYGRDMIALNQVIKHGGHYYAYYHGCATSGPDARKWSTAVAVSDDLIKWEKYPWEPAPPRGREQVERNPCRHRRGAPALHHASGRLPPHPAPALINGAPVMLPAASSLATTSGLSVSLVAATARPAAPALVALAIGAVIEGRAMSHASATWAGFALRSAATASTAASTRRPRSFR